MLGHQLAKISGQALDPITRMTVPQFLQYISSDLHKKAKIGERGCIVCYGSDSCESLTTNLQKLVGRSTQYVGKALNKWVFDHRCELEHNGFTIQKYTELSDCHCLVWTIKS